jgi:hypothetical protein
MTAKEILLSVAENLPANATLLDAINELEMFVGLEENSEVAQPLRAQAMAQKPEWIYDSPSRLCTVLRQTRSAASAPARSFCE